MRVLKFGGTSVADAAAMDRVVAIVQSRTGARTVVVSALGGVTDRLLAIGELAASDQGAARAALGDVLTRHIDVAAALGREAAGGVEPILRGVARGAERTVDAIAETRCASPVLLDKLAAAGEIWSSRLVAAFLAAANVRAQWIDARHVVRTDGRHRQAMPDATATEEAVRKYVRPALALDRVVVTGGFIGTGPDGSTTTLGRGGSDYSAALLGACLLADEIEIWTDVDGVFSADPRYVAEARVLPGLSYEDAEILATFGAKVLHPKTIEPAAALDIPVRVLNSRRPSNEGTRIDASGGGAEYAAVAARGNVTLVHVTSRERRPDRAFAARALQALADAHVGVLVGEVHKGRLTVAVDHDVDLEGLRSRLREFADVEARDGFSAVCAVGDRLSREPRLVARALAAFDGRRVRLVARPGDATSALAVVVEDRDVHSLLARLHEAFAADETVGHEAVA